METPINPFRPLDEEASDRRDAERVRREQEAAPVEVFETVFRGKDGRARCGVRVEISTMEEDVSNEKLKGRRILSYVVTAPDGNRSRDLLRLRASDSSVSRVYACSKDASVDVPSLHRRFTRRRGEFMETDRVVLLSSISSPLDPYILRHEMGHSEQLGDPKTRGVCDIQFFWKLCNELFEAEPQDPEKIAQQAQQLALELDVEVPNDFMVALEAYRALLPHLLARIDADDRYEDAIKNMAGKTIEEDLPRIRALEQELERLKPVYKEGLRLLDRMGSFFGLAKNATERDATRRSLLDMRRLRDKDFIDLTGELEIPEQETDGTCERSVRDGITGREFLGSKLGTYGASTGEMRKKHGKIPAPGRTEVLSDEDFVE